MCWVCAPLKGKTNACAVGKNGSGKSNLIFGTSPKLLAPYPLAIRFLLSNEFKSLRTEERKALLHVCNFAKTKLTSCSKVKMALSQVMLRSTLTTQTSAFLYVTLSFTLLTYQVESTEVRLRRVIGVSKADYYLNGKHISADDVMNLLESAGFSRSNPYYIVQQGKVRHK